MADDGHSSKEQLMALDLETCGTTLSPASEAQLPFAWQGLQFFLTSAGDPVFAIDRPAQCGRLVRRGHFLYLGRGASLFFLGNEDAAWGAELPGIFRPAGYDCRKPLFYSPLLVRGHCPDSSIGRTLLLGQGAQPALFQPAHRNLLPQPRWRAMASAVAQAAPRNQIWARCPLLAFAKGASRQSL